MPSAIVERLNSVRVEGKDYVFAGFADELRSYYRADPRKAHFAKAIKDFAPVRLRQRMQKHIQKWAKKAGLPGLTHNALRKTGMEVSDEAELLAFERRSAEKLRTTVDNKRRNYLKRRVAKRHYLLADALYGNFCEVLSEFPKLAERLGVEPEPEAGDNGLLDQIRRLSVEEQAKLMQDIMAGLIGNGRSAG
jgi:hypothetical protein